MGNCWSCFKLPPPPTTINQSDVPELQDDTMELKSSYSSNSYPKEILTSVQLRTNGNKTTSTSSETIVTSNNVGSDHCGSIPVGPNNLRLPRALYARLPPLGRSALTSATLQSESQPQNDFSEIKVNVLFDLYKDPHEDIILAEGIERLCNDLQLSPDDFKVLVFAWKLDAEQMCQFKRKEFINGLKLLRVDSIYGVQIRLPEIVQELTVNSDMFKDLYRFTFRFGLDVSSGQRILPVDMAIVLWKLVFIIREPPLLSRWLGFLEIHHVRGIPRDTWNMFLNFAEVIGNDLGAYDDAEAWPSLFDDFVEYENDQMNQNINKDDVKKDSIRHKV